MKRIGMLALLLALLSAPCALAETDGDCVYRLYAADGEYLTMRAGRMYVDDEYIAGDNRRFRVTEVDDSARAAYAEETEPLRDDPGAFQRAFAALLETSAQAAGKRGTVCMYSTHSDESYIPGDGESSKWKDAGIYDVGEAFRKALEKRGYEVIYSEKTFLPHDTGAYSRSAGTAKDLVQKSPAALFDIHRDGVDADEYETEVDGEDVSKVRLFVGRSNANKEANLAFAKEIKQAADELYPGLVKDIYMGKGSYNQELYPQALLLEFGTHEIEKDKVLDTAPYMAEVVDRVLSGGSAQASASSEKDAGAAKGIFWVIGIAVAAALLYALASTGKLSGVWDKAKRSASELTGGSVGKKRK